MWRACITETGGGDRWRCRTPKDLSDSVADVDS